jgi:hypothetical protein
MEAWTVERYRRPYLAVDQLAFDRDRKRIVLYGANDHLSIACDDQTSAVDIERGLQALRDPSSDLWAEIRDQGESSPWFEIVSALDSRSFVSDAIENKADEWIERELDTVEEAIKATKQAILHRLGEADIGILTDNISELLGVTGSLLRLGQARDSINEIEAPRPLAIANFYMAALGLQACYMRRSAPLSLIGLQEVIASFLGSNGTLWRDVARPLAGGLYSEKDLRVHLTTVADLLVRSIGPDAKRRCRCPAAASTSLSGIEFMRAAERATRAMLSDLGEGEFRSIMKTVRSSTAPALIGCYIEEYHVTRRFVEIITPVLSKRLDPVVRNLTFRYFDEENGHEAFERATCASLGVDEATLDTSFPLPLQAAFVDVFTHIAEIDPIGYFTSILVTEGMLGDPSSVGDIFDPTDNHNVEFMSVSRSHDNLNKTLNHTSISRLLLHNVKAVHPSTQARALEHLTFLVELNFRAWETLIEFYGKSDILRHHGWLSAQVASGRPITEAGDDGPGLV